MVMERKKELKKQIKKWGKEFDKLWNAGLPFEEWRKEAEKLNKEVMPIMGELNMITDKYELHDHLNFGELMPLEKFIGYCKAGGFCDSDGEGYYATKDKESTIHAVPSQICAGHTYRSCFDKGECNHIYRQGCGTPFPWSNSRSRLPRFSANL